VDVGVLEFAIRSRIAAMKFKPWMVLAGCCALLVLLWLPGLKYAPVSDTIVYGLLGREFWEHGRYWLLGMPFAKHLPLQAIISYPFTELFGLQAGMRLSTLAAGMGVLGATFVLGRKRFGIAVAIVGILAALFHPAFVLMSQQGSADLLFTLLFLLSVISFLNAQTDKRWYVLVGLFAGLMCLTRYNGIPVAVFFAGWVIARRRPHLRSPWLWAGVLIGIALIASWFIRNWITFGSPFHSEYTGELSAEAPNPFAQFFSNLLYYGNPMHNILPLLLPFSLYGLWLQGRKHAVLTGAMLSAWVLTAIWWVQAIRFAFAGYVLLTLFAAVGIVELWKRAGKWRTALGIILCLGFIGVHAPVMCVYTYGECNAWVDRTFRVLPPDLHLTPEGFYAWYQGKEYFNTHAESGALLVTEDPLNAVAWKEGVFRPDIQVSETRDTCPYYRIVQEQNVHPAEEVLFKTEDAPRTAVTKFPCMQ
jgi:4-amino-4-deoxy-L-arabinose transferase-like glycosyltransferase